MCKINANTDYSIEVIELSDLSVSAGRCRSSAACPAFVVDYDRGACFRLDLTSKGRTHLLTPARGHTAYFEKVCLQGKPINRLHQIHDREGVKGRPRQVGSRRSKPYISID